MYELFFSNLPQWILGAYGNIQILHKDKRYIPIQERHQASDYDKTVW